MSNSEESTGVVNLKAPPIYKVIIIQLLVSVIAALGAFTLLDIVTAYSVLLGGLISAVPNGYFARKAFQYRGARAVPLIIKSFYSGQTGKMAMTAVMFAMVFAGIKPLNELVVVLSFMVTIMAGLIATAYVGLKPTEQTK
jgi:ATP synthase protein I